MTQICVSKLAIIVSDNGLSPRRGQANVWTSAGMLLIGPLETIFQSVKFWSKFIHFHSRKCIWKRRLRNGRPFCLGLNVICTMHKEAHVKKSKFLKILKFCVISQIYWTVLWNVYFVNNSLFSLKQTPLLNDIYRVWVTVISWKQSNFEENLH